MNAIKLFTIVLFASLFCNRSFAQVSNPDTTRAFHSVQYTCSMHPEVLTDSPGKCPKCGMQLVEKSKVSDAKNIDMMHHGMMGGMSDTSHKRKFPMVLMMGIMMAIMMVVVIAKK